MFIEASVNIMMKGIENMPLLNQQFKLPDGRLLGYNEYGMPDGRPMFIFHGIPSSRNEWNMWGGEVLAQKFNLHVIAPDRPGIGLSSFQPGRRLHDWVADVTALADKLGLERFAVLGYSAGGPYAAVCALKIPERLTAVGIVSGMASHNVPGLVKGTNPYSLLFDNLARDHPELSRLVLRLIKFVDHYTPSIFISLMRSKLSTLPESDKAVLANTDAERFYVEIIQESMHSGPRGVQVDTALIVSPWDFCLQNIDIPVHLWYGEADVTVPPTMGRYLAATIPNCHAKFYPNEGHLSTFFNHKEDILTTFTS